MSTGNDTKTREQLLAELAALKEQLDERQTAGPSPGASTPVFSAPLTRRQSMVSWVAPVILSLPILQGVGAILKPGTAHAADSDTDDSPIVVAVPTARPTVGAAAPTVSPTAGRTVGPTRAGRCVVPPTVAPTLGMAAAPDARPSLVGFLALGSARAVCRGDMRP